MTLAETPIPSPANDRRAAQRRRILDVARRHFLDVARRHFLARGFAAATMSAIAADVGGSKTTLWSHFESKEGLFAALVDADSRDIHTKTLALLDRDGAPFDILRAFAESFIGAMASPAVLKLQRQVAAEADRIAVGDLLYDRLVGVVEARLATFFAARMATGALRRGDPLHAARLTIALCLGLDPHRLFWPVDALGAASSAHAGIVLGALKTLFSPSDGDEDETQDDDAVAGAAGLRLRRGA